MSDPASIVPPAAATATAVVEPARQPASSPASHRITCECCGCQLTPAGEVMQRGDRAAKFLRQEDRIKDLEADLEKRDRALEELKKLVAPENKPQAKRLLDLFG